MFRFLIRRILQMILAFFGTTLIVYALMFAAQNDPIQALAGEKPSAPRSGPTSPRSSTWTRRASAASCTGTGTT